MEDTVLGLLIGLGLAASCGFRVFVPLLVMGLAGASGHLDLAEGFQWMAEPTTITIFAAATVLEVGAYYLPGLDHLLDTVASPAAVVAGSVATASMVGDLSPALTWSLGIIGGGGAAAAVQAGTVKLRTLSGMSTGGLGNPLVATGELAGAVVTPALAILAPVVVLAGLVLIAFALSRWLAHRRGPRPPGPPAAGPGSAPG